MPVALPGTRLRPSLPLRSLRNFAVLLAAVLLLHLWLLGGARQGLVWLGALDTPSEAAKPMTTRMIPAPRPKQAATEAPITKQGAQPAERPSPPLTQPPSPATAAEAVAPPDAPTEPAPPPPVGPAVVAMDSSTALTSGPADALADVPTSASTIAPAPSDTATARTPRVAVPPPVVLNYDVFGQTEGQKNVVSAAITWKHDGETYQASLTVTKFMVGLRQWTSKGALTVNGLAPVRFGEKGFRRAEVASHFVREEGRVIFSANASPAPLLPGAQDHLSVFMQLASLWAGEPDRLKGGDTLAFQSIGPRQAETWTFVVSAEERITVPGGSMQAIKLTREPTGDYSTKAEIWLAPQLAYLPAHIRLTEPNGNVLDMLWTDSRTPAPP